VDLYDIIIIEKVILVKYIVNRNRSRLYGSKQRESKTGQYYGMMGIMQNDISTPMHIVREETSKTPKDTANKLFFVVKLILEVARWKWRHKIVSNK
jgi:hypothetical protein